MMGKQTYSWVFRAVSASIVECLVLRVGATVRSSDIKMNRTMPSPALKNSPSEEEIARTIVWDMVREGRKPRGGSARKRYLIHPGVSEKVSGMFWRR